MGYNVQCDNSGCRLFQYPELDLKNSKKPEDWEVICAECGKDIKSVTEFAKRSMAGMGQIKRAKTKQQAFAVKCVACKQEARPVLGTKNSLLCAHCNVELNLSGPFKQSLLVILGAHKS